MSERLEIDVDFRTATALQNTKALLAELEALDKKLSDTTRNLNAAEDQVNDTARAEEQLAESTKKATTAVQAEADAVRRDTGEKARAKEQTTGLATATEGLANQVKNWITGYAGLSGVLQLMNLIDARMKSMVEAQRELVREKWDLDLKLKSVADNLQITDLKVARRLTLGVAKETAMTVEGAANLIGSGASLGYDVRDARERQSVVNIGQFASRVRLTGPNELDALFKTVNAGKAQGYSEQQILAILNAAGTAVGASNPQEFNTGLLAGIGPALAQGVDLRRAVTQYGALVSVAPSTRQGADFAAMLYTLAQLRQPQARASVAGALGRMGKLATAPVTADDLEAVIAGDSEDAQAIRTMREEIDQIETVGPMQDADFEAGLTAKVRRGTISRAEADKQRQMRQLTLVRDRDQRLGRLREDLDRRMGKVRGGMEGERQQAALMALPLDVRLELLKDAAGDPEMQSVLLESMGGKAEYARALLMAASPSGRAREASIRDAIYSPRSMADYKRVTAGFMATSEALNAAQAAEQAGKDADLMTPATEATERWWKEGEAEFRRRKSRDEIGWFNGGLTLTNDQALNAMMGKRLRAEIEEMTEGMSESEKQVFLWSMGPDAVMLMRDDAIPRMMPTEGRLRRLHQRLVAHRRLRSLNQQERGGEVGPQLREHPQPEASDVGPQSSVGPTYNVNISNYWAGPADDLDLSEFSRFG